MHTKIEIFWSMEDDGWIALDLLRPGCSAFGISEKDALREKNADGSDRNSLPTPPAAQAQAPQSK